MAYMRAVAFAAGLAGAAMMDAAPAGAMWAHPIAGRCGENSAIPHDARSSVIEGDHPRAE